MSQAFIFPHAAESDKKIPDAVSIFAHELQNSFQPQALLFRPCNAHSATLPERLVSSWRSTVIPPSRGFGRCDRRAEWRWHALPIRRRPRILLKVPDFPVG